MDEPGLVVVWLLLAVLACGLISARIAENRSGWWFLWFLVGILFGPVGVALTWAVAGTNSVCGYCQKSIHPRATKCPYCQSDFAVPAGLVGNATPACAKPQVQRERHTTFPFLRTRWFWFAFTVMIPLVVLCLYLIVSDASERQEPPTGSPVTTANALSLAAPPTSTASAQDAPASSQVAGRCWSYSPAEVKLDGTITSKTFPAKPAFESTESSIEPERVWILVLSAPTCTNEQKADGQTQDAEAIVTEMQLLLDQTAYDIYQPLLDKTVTVTGTLIHSFTEHHHTPVMLSVSTIEP